MLQVTRSVIWRRACCCLGYCLCCTVRGDLVWTLENLTQRAELDAVPIETTGLADPAPVASTFIVSDEIKPKFSLPYRIQRNRPAVDSWGWSLWSRGQIAGKSIFLRRSGTWAWLDSRLVCSNVRKAHWYKQIYAVDEFPGLGKRRRPLPNQGLVLCARFPRAFAVSERAHAHIFAARQVMEAWWKQTKSVCSHWSKSESRWVCWRFFQMRNFSKVMLAESCLVYWHCEQTLK